MNINLADKTYSFISSTNTDNLMRFSVFSSLQQRAFIFIMKNYLYIRPLILILTEKSVSKQCRP